MSKAVLSKCVVFENEVRVLFKVFGIKLPPKIGHGAFDAEVRDTIEADVALSHALLPMLDASVFESLNLDAGVQRGADP